jgi:NAD(P)-dependent dehydrogenase (short-subunit alcohol dehydrogenase family)
MTTPVWFITGASGGLGRAVVEYALQSGQRVMATTRDPCGLADLMSQYPTQLRVWNLDATSASDARKAVKATCKAFGRIDVVVNNAATVVMGPAESMTADDLHTQMDVVFFGTVNVTQAAIPVFRAQQAGHFLQITSINTRRPLPGLGAYAAAKWAVTGFSHAVALELAPFNIRVTMIETGGLRTSMVNADQVRPYDSEYEPTVGKEANRFLQRAGSEPLDPIKVAEVLEHVTTLPDPPLRLVLGADAVRLVESLNRTRAAEDARWAHLGQIVDYD